uniref:Secreted protein n=1 Tax=Steinernema glaseri TaxID=37863 RepID=A0A1I7ZIT1_9BILA
MQDINMIVVVAAIVICNNDSNTSTLGVLLSYDGLVFIYILNTVSMTFFNPECRRFLFKSTSKVSATYHVRPTEGGTHWVMGA